MGGLKFHIEGQLKSGKNNMLTTRAGKHYPNPKWAVWRDEVMNQLWEQNSRPTITKPCSIVVHYTAGDNRRRDVPGMMDALWHCLERAKIVSDDKFFANVKWISFFEKGKARVDLMIK